MCIPHYKNSFPRAIRQNLVCRRLAYQITEVSRIVEAGRKKECCRPAQPSCPGSLLLPRQRELTAGRYRQPGQPRAGRTGRLWLNGSAPGTSRPALRIPNGACRCRPPTQHPPDEEPAPKTEAFLQPPQLHQMRRYLVAIMASSLYNKSIKTKQAARNTIDLDNAPAKLYEKVRYWQYKM